MNTILKTLLLRRIFPPRRKFLAGPSRGLSAPNRAANDNKAGEVTFLDFVRQAESSGFTETEIRDFWRSVQYRRLRAAAL